MKSSSKTDWAKLAAMPDEDIDTSDIPPLSEKFFEMAQLRLPRELLASLIVDGINTFVRDVLVARGLVDLGRYQSENGIVEQEYAIANKLVDCWKPMDIRNVG